MKVIVTTQLERKDKIANMGQSVAVGLITSGVTWHQVVLEYGRHPGHLQNVLFHVEEELNNKY